MCSPHAFLNFRNRHIKVQSKGKYDTSHKNNEDCKGSILEICDLDFHGSEFNAPAYVGTRWRWLETHVLPICTLQVFEMVRVDSVILVDCFVEDDEGGSNE